MPKDLTREDKLRILRTAFQEQMLTGKPRGRTALHLLSAARRDTVQQALHDPAIDLKSLERAANDFISAATNGRITTWRELEMRVITTTSPALRLFNICALVEQRTQLVENLPADTTIAYPNSTLN